MFFTGIHHWNWHSWRWSMETIYSERHPIRIRSYRSLRTHHNAEESLRPVRSPIQNPRCLWSLSVQSRIRQSRLYSFVQYNASICQTIRAHSVWEIHQYCFPLLCWSVFNDAWSVDLRYIFHRSAYYWGVREENKEWIGLIILLFFVDRSTSFLLLKLVNVII